MSDPRPPFACARIGGAGLLALVLVAASVACKTAGPTEKPPGPLVQPPPLPVKRVNEELVVAAWSEPKELPAGGGQAQILVRVQHRGGAPYPGVEVRLSTSSGTLFSGGKVLVTDAAGRIRDRLTATRLALVTLNAGGTAYRFRVPVRASE
jgi:hypothetical protein